FVRCTTLFRSVGVERAEDPDEALLGEVLGVVPVAGQAQGEPEDPCRVLLDDLRPRRGRGPRLHSWLHCWLRHWLVPAPTTGGPRAPQRRHPRGRLPVHAVVSWVVTLDSGAERFLSIALSPPNGPDGARVPRGC